MSVTAATELPEQLVERVQDLQARLDASADPATRRVAEELVSAIVQMYGAGLEQIVGSLMEAGDEGERLAVGLADDPLVAMLMFIHDLHPVPLEDRVGHALEQVRPYMESHGGNVELLSLTDGVARLRLEGSCSDCSASAVTLELAIKQALEEAAPDLDGLEVEGITLDQEHGVAPEMPVAPVAPSWVEVGSLDLLTDGKMVAAEVAGAELVVANVGGTLLAYRDVCADCGGALHAGVLLDGALTCPECSRMYFLPRAGRSMDADHLQLDPVPLLRDRGTVKVAVAT